MSKTTRTAKSNPLQKKTVKPWSRQGSKEQRLWKSITNTEGKGMNAVPQRELTSLGSCFTNDKLRGDERPVVVFCGSLVHGKKISQHRT